MIVRRSDGKIQIVKRSNFKNDLSYHSYIYHLVKEISLCHTNTSNHSIFYNEKK